jgi:hypothetical protein
MFNIILKVRLQKILNNQIFKQEIIKINENYITTNKLDKLLIFNNLFYIFYDFKANLI